MSLYDDLYKASFRGIEFAIDSDDVEIGRRVKTHNIQNRDYPYHEDLGGETQPFSVEAVIGNGDFITKAKAFEDALLMPGAGKLVLPHQGEIRVVAIKARRRHSSKEVGIVRFSITFERSEEADFSKSASFNTVRELDLSTSSAFDALSLDFIDKYISGAPDFVTGDITAQIEGTISCLRISVSDVKSVLNGRNISVDDATDLADGMRSICTDIIGIFAPKSPFVPAVDIVNDAQPNTIETIASLAFVAGVSNVKTNESPLKTQAIRVNNKNSVDLISRGDLLITAARLNEFADYESKQEAIIARNTMLDALSSLRRDLGNAGWVTSWQAVSGVQNALNRDMSEKIGRLPATATINTQKVRSSLALSHRLYGDDLSVVIAKANDLAKRNKVNHPAFMPSHNLEVLIDG